MSFILSRRTSLHLPIQSPPLSECALDIHVRLISCDMSSPSAPSSWLVICPPAHPIGINSAIHFHLRSGQASHILASVEYVRTLDRHAIEFAVSYPVADAPSQEPQRAWAYLSVLRDWALLPQTLSSVHHLLYDFLPDSLPRLAEGSTPNPITPWTPCIHIRREKMDIRSHSPDASQKRREEYLAAYVFLIGRLPPPPPMPPLRVSLPARPWHPPRSTHSRRAISQVARPIPSTRLLNDTILARPARIAKRTC
ncbi:hypothetical protein EWM64_g10539 [Hericium alpestre]|uniref:Uncharacterized protein n=1 Tax=Hericium alpestre TaxID=135208 RepID=A0A4Y9ZGC7_9AGAM|nr:hypothetical protein EWM64_g10539 [Hericium alpestre]